MVAAPTIELVTRNGVQGQSWSLPYSAGKIRYDQDAKKNVCNTIDVAFHPIAFVRAKEYSKF